MPGETVSIQDGDLAIDGQTVLKPPPLLAEVASAVTEATIVAASDDAADGRWQRIVSLPSVLDDAAFAPEERRMLLPVRDVGLAAVIHLPESPVDHAAVRVLARVGGFVVPWRLKASGRYAVVAGRLDGHVVGAVWPIADADGLQERARFCLPPPAPVAWDVVRPWPDDVTIDADDTPPSLGLGLTSAGIPIEYTMLRGIFQPPGVTAEQTKFYVDLLAKVRETPEWKDFMNKGAFKQTSLSGQEYFDWLGRAEQAHRVLMKDAGFIAN
jgi:hypothetical protein